MGKWGAVLEVSAACARKLKGLQGGPRVQAGRPRELWGARPGRVGCGALPTREVEEESRQAASRGCGSPVPEGVRARWDDTGGGL